MSFWLVPNSVTLNDLEQRNRNNGCVISRNSVAFLADCVKVVEDTRINVKNDVYKKGYRRRSCTSKTAKIHRFVRFVMYCSIAKLPVPVAFYWACSDDTVSYKSDKTMNFCGFRCTTTSPKTVFINVVFYIYISCFFISLYSENWMPDTFRNLQRQSNSTFNFFY